MFGKRFSRALAVTTVASLVLAAAAFAQDQLLADGDGDDPVANNLLNLGSVCPDGSIEPELDNVLVAARAVNRTSGSWYGNASVVSVSGATTASNLSLTSDSFTTNSDWTTAPANTVSTDAASLRVTLDDAGDTEGLNTATVTWTASGAGFTRSGNPPSNSPNPNVQLTQTMTVGWTVKDDQDPDCAPPNTAPTVTVAGVSATDYEYGSVPAATCDVTDTEDGPSSFAATLSTITGPYATYGIGSQTANCSYTDDGGLNDTDSVTYNIVDTTGPVITAPADLLNFEADSLGGGSQAAVLAALGAATATDAVFGAVPAASITNDAPSVFPVGTTTVTFSASDLLGNPGIPATADVQVVDTTAPTISGMPSNQTRFTMGTGVAVSWTSPTASDIVDGTVPVTCSPVSGSTFTQGTTTVDCSAEDEAGNVAQASFTVTVNILSAMWKEPINGPSVINVAKAGRVIPVKVEVFLNGVENQNTGEVTFKLYKSNGCTAGATDAVETFAAVGEAAGGDAYVWNADGGWYQYNLKTPSTPGCYTGQVLLNGNVAGYFLINATK